MQPGRARTSGLEVPLLPLARWVGWVAPVRPTHGVLVLSCPSAALRVCSVFGRWAPVHRCARAVCCGASAVSWASWLLFTGVRAVCGARVPRVVLSLLLPPQISVFFCFFLFLFFYFFFLGGGGKEKTKKRKTGARVHCRHRHGQLVRRCNSVVSSGVCRRCCGGGRAPGVRLARPDVHGLGSGWVW